MTASLPVSSDLNLLAMNSLPAVLLEGNLLHAETQVRQSCAGCRMERLFRLRAQSMYFLKDRVHTELAQWSVLASHIMGQLHADSPRLFQQAVKCDRQSVRIGFFSVQAMHEISTRHCKQRPCSGQEEQGWDGRPASIRVVQSSRSHRGCSTVFSRRAEPLPCVSAQRCSAPVRV